MSFTNIHVTDKVMLACDEDKSSNPSQFLTVSLSPTPKVLLRGEATPESDTPCAAMEGEKAHRRTASTSPLPPLQALRPGACKTGERGPQSRSDWNCNCCH